MSEVSTSPPLLLGDTAVFRIDPSSKETSIYYYDGSSGLKNIRGLTVDRTTFQDHTVVLAADNASGNVHWIRPPNVRRSILTMTVPNGPWKVVLHPSGHALFSDSTRPHIFLVGSGFAGAFIDAVEPRSALLISGDSLYFSDEGSVWKMSRDHPLRFGRSAAARRGRERRSS